MLIWGVEKIATHYRHCVLLSYGKYAVVINSEMSGVGLYKRPISDYSIKNATFLACL